MTVGFFHLGKLGRLGNSLYQIAATAGVAATRGTEPRYNDDWLHRPYFSVPDHLFQPDADELVVDTPEVRHIDKRARSYLQSLPTFAHILPTLREWFQPSDLALEIMAADPQVAVFEKLRRPILAVHVRRGDNVPGQDPGTPNKHLWHPLPPLSFYQQAIDRFDPPAGSGVYSPSIAVFGDDPEWNKANIPGDYHHVGVSRPKEHEASYLTAPVLDWLDWQLLVSADAAVVSNSTYGIMAAIIGDHDHVVYPWPLFGPNLNYIDASLMVPAEWDRIDYRALTPSADRTPI